MRDQEKEAFVLDIDNTELLHPVLDYKNGISILGFRAMRKGTDDRLTDTNIYLLIEKDSINVYQSHETVKDKKRVTACYLNGQEVESMKFLREDTDYRINSDKKYLLPILKEKWSGAGIEGFIKQSEPVKPNTAYETIRGLLESFCHLPSDTDYDILTAWIMGTYFHRLFFSFPFLHIKAPKASGKSQLLGVMEKLSFNAIKSRSTPASMGDTITSLRATLLIDQADSLHGENNIELLEMLTDSYKMDGGKRRVMDMTKGRKILEFDTYSPKAFASTIDLPEDLRDRCILLPIMRSANQYPVPDDQNADFRLYRGFLYRMIAHSKDLSEKASTIRETYQNHEKLNGRTLDLWLPIESIMTLCKVSDDRINQARDLYLSRYSQMEYEPKEYERDVIEVILEFLGNNEKGEYQVIDITNRVNNKRLEAGIKEDIQEQRVGYVIKNFNLSDSKKRKTKGTYYQFTKEIIEEILKSYC